jgi:hypothetical protein
MSVVRLTLTLPVPFVRAVIGRRERFNKQRQAPTIANGKN